MSTREAPHGAGYAEHPWETQEALNEAIDSVCDSLMAAGLWHEIDGDGTEFSVICDHIGRLIAHTEALRSCVKRFKDGWMPVTETSGRHTLEEVYGFDRPHWCLRNAYGGPLTSYPRPVPMTWDEIEAVDESWRPES